MNGTIKQLFEEKVLLENQLAATNYGITKFQDQCPHPQNSIKDVMGPEAGKTDPICQDCGKWM